MTAIGSRAIAILAVASLVGLGWYLRTADRLEREVSLLKAQQPPKTQSVLAATLDGKVVTSEPEHYGGTLAERRFAAVFIQDFSSILNGDLQDLRWKAPTPDRRYDLEGTISSFAREFGATEAEIEALQVGVRNAWQSVVAGLAGSAEVERLSNDQVAVAINNPSAATVASRFQDSIRQILGDERYLVFDKLGLRQQIDRAVGDVSNSVLTITRTTDDLFGARYVYQRRTAGHGSSGGSFRRESLEKSLGPLGSVIPSDFLGR